VKATICLMVMAKNEAHVIERALASAIAHVDAVVVTDTGSTDGTQEVVERFCKTQGIQPIIVNSPWRGWAESRQEMFENAKQSGCEYAIQLDADDALEVAPDAEMPEEDGPSGYSIRIREGSESWDRPDMLRLDQPWEWGGADHPRAHIAGALPGDVDRLRGWRTKVIGGGGRSVSLVDQVEKWRRGAADLEKRIAECPDDAHAWFYAGQNHMESGNFERALECFTKRFELGGVFQEELWRSLWLFARCTWELGRWLEIPAAYLYAYQFRPTRCEPLVDLARYYRLRGWYDSALPIARLASTIPLPKEDRLPLREDFYEWQAKTEQMTAEWKAARGDKETAKRLALELLAESKFQEQMRPYVAQIAGILPDYITEEQRERLALCCGSSLVVFTTGGPGVEKWIGRCIASVASQTVTPKIQVVMLAEEVARERARAVAKEIGADHVLVLDPTEHSYDAALRLYRVLPRSAIVVTVDGDDKLANAFVLETIQKRYDEDPECWMTYGDLQMSDPTGAFAGWHCSEYPLEVVVAGTYKDDHWRASHLRTVRAGLVQAIPWEHLLRNGEIIHPAWDQLYSLPCLEMAREHAQYIPQVLLIWNNENTESSHNAGGTAMAEERSALAWVRSRPMLPRLKERPW